MSLEMTADRIFFSVGVSGRNRMAAMPHRFAAAAVLAGRAGDRGDGRARDPRCCGRPAA
ncbi:hypothetical protein JG536_05740 [Burkholderia ambifaria]|uniref:hypothetical protein n=1 Tax=Burkholderia ambifaria TaxID=152480 RepID=UPI00158D7B1A|nr:hypothetical protein [Burkholderia ambifaria]QQJ98157.1 hypothetical protein JG536_05740 [Burkholderia ambifaria]